MSELTQKRCIPCEGGTLPLERSDSEKLLLQLPGWELSDDGKKISKQYVYANFAEALAFADKVGVIAEQENHHPDLLISWGKANVTLSTHSIGGLSENDFIVASKIEEIP